MHDKSSLLTAENPQKLRGSSVIKQSEFGEVVTMSVFSSLYYVLFGKILVNSKMLFEEYFAKKSSVLIKYIIHGLTKSVEGA